MLKKNGDTFSLLKDSVKWNTKNTNLKDGKYKVGIRPHNITTYKEGNNSVEIKGKVLISELSGSESLIHFRNAKFRLGIFVKWNSPNECRTRSKIIYEYR